MKSKYPTSTPKVDFPIKFSGEAKFTDDIVFDDALNAKTLRATIAKGKIKSITLPKLPEGYYYFDKNDVKENVVNIIFSDWPVFVGEKVNYLGEGIGIFVGKDLAVLDQLIAETKVEYIEETPQFDLVAARQPLSSNLTR